MSNKSPRRLSFLRGLILAAAALLAAALPSPASAQWTLKTLYSFCTQPGCADGQNPGYGSLVMDASGNLYGTAMHGGPNFSGAAYELTSSGEETVFYGFCASTKCTRGRRPMGGLAMGPGAPPILWGTTYGRGSLTQGGNPGGVIYKAIPGHGGFTQCVLGRPTSCDPGEFSVASPIYNNGYLYVTTSWGGTNYLAGFYCCGTVFSMMTEFTNTPLQLSYSFCSLADCRDGARPEAPVILDGSGNVYGTTVYGGASGGGVVFEVTPGVTLGSAATEQVLYNFCSALDCTDGWYPHGGLVFDGSGNLYGTTTAGGAKNGGTVFKLAPGGGETVLYSFCAVANCADGAAPQGGLVMDGSGNLYGTTESGGANNGGTVFEVSAGGQQTVLYSFCSAAKCGDGKAPLAGLLMDKSGNLYGTTSKGGANGEGGTAFELVQQ